PAAPGTGGAGHRPHRHDGVPPAPRTQGAAPTPRTSATITDPASRTRDPRTSRPSAKSVPVVSARSPAVASSYATHATLPDDPNGDPIPSRIHSRSNGKASPPSTPTVVGERRSRERGTTALTANAINVRSVSLPSVSGRGPGSRNRSCWKSPPAPASSPRGSVTARTTRDAAAAPVT